METSEGNPALITGSLGYCYYSAQAAAKASHAKCNCLIVPRIGKKTPEIDGYDPDVLYMQWVDGLKRECAEINVLSVKSANIWFRSTR